MFHSLPKTTKNAITGYGGFSFTNESIPIQQNKKLIDEYDITNSVQLLYDVSKINEKIGLFKMNHIIIKSDFDNEQNIFPIDNIEINSNELIEDLELSSILSLGKLKTSYNNFNRFIEYITSHKELFDLYEENKLEIDYENFDEENLYCLLKKENGFFGSVSIKNVNEILNNTIFFENHKNIPKKNGFINDDLLFIPYGLKILLSYDINIDKLNYFGKKYILNLKNETDYDDGNCYINTSFTESKITRTIKVPLLFKFYSKITENIGMNTLMPNSIETSVIETHVNTTDVNTTHVNTYTVNSFPLNNFPVNTFHVNNFPVNTYTVNNFPVNNFTVNNFPVNNFHANTYTVNNFPVNNFPVNTYQKISTSKNNLTIKSTPVNIIFETQIRDFNITDLHIPLHIQNTTLWGEGL